MDIDQSAEILRLRATVRDLLALSIIPEAWVGREPPAIAADLADLLIGSLVLDFAFVRLCDPTGCQAVEVTRGNCWKAFPEWLQQRFVRFGQVSRTEIVTNVGGVEKSCCGVVIPIGVNSERGLVAAACDRSDFPDQIDQQLLSVAANNAATAFQNAFLINELRSAQEALRGNEQELRKAHDELEIKVAERTAELQRSAQGLQRSEFYLAEGQRLGHTGSWALNPSGFFEYWSRELFQIYGLDPQKGAPTLEQYLAAVHPQDRDFMAETVERMCEQGSGCDAKKRIIRPDGAVRYIRCVGVPVLDNGVLKRFLGTAMDVTEQEQLTQELQRREAYLAEAQRLSHTGSFGWKPDSGEIVWSDETYRIFEYDPAVKPTIDSVVQRAHPYDRALIQQVIDRASQTGTDFEHEYRLLLADGRVKHVHAIAHALQDADGNREFIGAVTDITERKTTEEQLRWSAQELQRSEFYLAEGQRLGQAGSWALNPSGCFEYWSRELFQIYGLDPQKGAPTLEQYLATVHPQDRDFMANTIKRMHAERCGCDAKKRIVRPDGELRYVRCVGIPVIEGEALKGFLGTAMDITEQELLTQEVERQRVHLTEAQRLTHTGSWARRLVDRKMKTEHLSEEWYRIYGFDPAEGSPTWEEVLERVHPEDRLEWTGITERAIVERADFDHEFRILLPNGKVKWIRTVGHPVLSNTGDLEGFVGSSTDITELKSAEQEREKLRQLEADLAHINRVSTLGEMAASLAHEIKQPIAAAITSANSCIEWLAHEPPNLDRARAAAARIDKYGNRAAEIIDRMRSLYKKSPPKRELVDVNGIIQEILTLLDGEVSRLSVAMRPDLSAKLPKIMADRIQLQQVFMNLMLNAIEAMKDSGGELTVKSELQDGQLQFSVSDTGVGLPTEKVDQIFSAFFTTKPQGSGMGLAISRSIVESHGGRLWASANSGAGATFHFTLPIQVTESSPLVFSTGLDASRMI